MEKKSDKSRVKATVKEVKVLEFETKKGPEVGYKIDFCTEEGKLYSGYWPMVYEKEEFLLDNMEQLRWLTTLILFDNEKIVFSQLAELIGKEVSLVITKLGGNETVFAIGRSDESLYLIQPSFFHNVEKRAPSVFFKSEEVEKFWKVLQ